MSSESERDKSIVEAALCHEPDRIIANVCRLSANVGGPVVKIGVTHKMVLDKIQALRRAKDAFFNDIQDICKYHNLDAFRDEEAEKK